MIGYGVGYSIALDPAGSGAIYTTGFFSGTVDFDPGEEVFNLTSGGHDIFISKLDRSGNFIWAKAMGGTNGVNGYSIAIDPAGNGGVYTTGNFTGTVDFDPGPATYNLTSAGVGDIFISNWTPRVIFYGQKHWPDLSTIIVTPLLLTLPEAFTSQVFSGQQLILIRDQELTI